MKNTIRTLLPPIVLLLIVTGVLLGANFGTALAEAKSCSTAQCHNQIGKATHVHPALQMECTFCHQPQDEKTMFEGPRHRFKLAAEGADLCYMCHGAKNTKEVVHIPVQAGMCTLCHDPHQSANPTLLKEEPLSKLCYQCHERNKDTGAHVHAPVSMGLCTSCHNPHESPNPSLLRHQGPELCFECHSGKKEAIASGRVVHPPASMDCTMCHDPHTAPNKYQLKSAPPELCLMCHANIQERIAQAAVVHGAILKDGTCLNCHDPHAADQDKLLKRAVMELCLSCHNATLKDNQGKELANIKALLEKNPKHHGPILAEDCISCHNPHGSKNFRLLVRRFPATLYAPYKEEAYALCFGCHDPALASEARTASATDFRNGDKNLHFVHVNKTPKGRTCRFCHQVHASTRPRHLRESVSFGKWELPLDFTVLPNGGKCMVGCHAPKSYDRSIPVKTP